MTSTRSLRLFTLVQKELQENRLSLIWTPLVVAAALCLLMLLSVMFASRITAMSDTFLEVIMAEEMGISPVITIELDDNHTASSPSSDSRSVTDMQVQSVEEPLAEEEWDFSREWRFEPELRDKPAYEAEQVGSLNPVFHLVHSLLLIILMLVTVSYLLGSLFNDRKDRSILFWKSMPVSEWEEVLTRLGVALVVAPGIYIAVSLLLQLALLLLAMLLVWRMELDPFDTVLANVRFADLLLRQVGGWVMTALWVAPVYAWLMLASAWARRSPFMVAFAPVIALMLVESLMLGSRYVFTAVSNHVPFFVGGQSSDNIYFHSMFWKQFDFVSLFAGLGFAAILLLLCVYLRRYRFEA